MRSEPLADVSRLVVDNTLRRTHDLLHFIVPTILHGSDEVALPIRAQKWRVSSDKVSDRVAHLDSAWGDPEKQTIHIAPRNSAPSSADEISRCINASSFERELSLLFL